jgi:hypothetical protein
MKEELKQETVEKQEVEQFEESPIEEERRDRILETDDLYIDRQVLEGFVGYVYEYLVSQTSFVNDFNALIKEANNSERKKRKISVNLKEFSEFVNNFIKHSFRMQGVITAVQKNIDSLEYKCKNNESNV